MTTEPEQPLKSLIPKSLGLVSWVVLWAIPIAIVGDMWLRQTTHSGSSIWIWIAAAAWALPRSRMMVLAHCILISIVLIVWAVAMLRFGADSDSNSAWITVCFALAVLALGFMAWLWDKMTSPGIKSVARTAAITALIVVTFFSALAFAGLLLHNVDWRKALTEDWYMALLVLYLPLMGLGWWGYMHFLHRRP